MEISEVKRCLAVSTLLTNLLAAPGILAQPTEPPPQTQSQARPADPHAAAELAAEKQALGFLQYLDQGRYADSYAYTSELIRSKMDDKKFAKEIRKAREPAGTNVSRRMLDVSYTKTLPGVAPGRYVVLQYQVDFAVKKDRVETLTLSYENGYWRVAGWHLDQMPQQPPAGAPQGQPQQQPPGQPQQQPDQGPPQNPQS